MYPSGKWVGHWDQEGLGRQKMNDLQLSFKGHLVEGRGWDRVGPFSITGELVEGFQIRLLKQYVGQHQVVYAGEHDGEGTIVGIWALAGDQGTFAMRPDTKHLTGHGPISELRPGP